MPRVLIIEDEPTTAKMLIYTCKEGYPWHFSMQTQGIFESCRMA